MATKLSLKKSEIIFLILIYLSGVFLRLFPRLSLDPHLLCFEADIWYRVCLAQYLLDHGHLPAWDIRYEAYGHVPVWYNPLAIYFLAGLSKLFALDLPTVCSRVMPFIESFAVLSIYFLCRKLYNKRVALITTLFLQLSPAFTFWTGISTLQSFTLFLIPIMILLWIKFLQNKFLLNDRWLHLSLMGFLLAVDFLFHLSFFNLVIILVLVHLGLILESQAQVKHFRYLLIPLFLSQALTLWWWGPKNLYWWWSQVLTTSSAFFEGMVFLKHYGILSGILGHLALIILIVFIIKHHKAFPPFYLVPILWAIYPMIETHNEAILKLIHHSEWTWVNIMKPLEGFRFYCFLSQPLAVCFGIVLDKIFETNFIQRLKFQKILIVFVISIFSFALLFDMLKNYNLFGRFSNPSMQIEEVEAAQWFRKHSKPTDRILAEYFTSQMFCGICGGKCLEGSMFPLKNVHIPYITEGWLVQKDTYSVYTTDDPGWIGFILKRYGCTHVFYSKKSMRHIEYITKGDIVLEDITSLEGKDFSATLFNPQYFKTIYENKDIKILEWLEQKMSVSQTSIDAKKILFEEIPKSQVPIK